MLMDNYPAGMSECDRNGLNGNCGADCSVYQDGECKFYEEKPPIQLTLPFFPAAEQNT